MYRLEACATGFCRTGWKPALREGGVRHLIVLLIPHLVGYPYTPTLTPLTRPASAIGPQARLATTHTCLATAETGGRLRRRLRITSGSSSSSTVVVAVVVHRRATLSSYLRSAHRPSAVAQASSLYRENVRSRLRCTGWKPALRVFAGQAGSLRYGREGFDT